MLLKATMSPPPIALTAPMMAASLKDTRRSYV